MFGKKKKEEVKEEPTPVVKVGMEKATAVSSLDIPRYIVDEFQATYMHILGEKDLEKVNSDTLSLNLLFAIYGELRLARLEREKR